MGFAGLALDVMLHRDGFGNRTGLVAPERPAAFRAESQERDLAVHERRREPHGKLRSEADAHKYAGKTIAETPFADVLDPKKLAIERLVVARRQRQSAQHALPAPDRLPEVRPERHRGQRLISRTSARNVDRLAIVRSMWTTDSNHGAQTQFHSGRHMNDGEFPTLGAWVHYGLGSLNENLPQFISIGTREYWNKRDGLYLGPGPRRRAARASIPKNPLDFCRPERAIFRRGASRRHQPEPAS